MKNAIARTAALVIAAVAFAAPAMAQTYSTNTGAQALVVMTEAESVEEMVEGYEEQEMNVGTTVEAFASLKGIEADASVRGAIEERVVELAPEAKVVRTLLSGDKWVVRVNELGLPKSEYRKGFVVYQVEGIGAVCQQIVVERPYFAEHDDVSDYVVKLGAMVGR